MHEDLFEDARRAALESEPPVKAAALMHLARVRTVSDQADAEKLFESGLALLPMLSERDRDTIGAEAAVLAGAVAPHGRAICWGPEPA